MSPTGDKISLPMTVIKIRPHHWGWKAFETPGVEPAIQSKSQTGWISMPRSSEDGFPGLMFDR